MKKLVVPILLIVLVVAVGSRGIKLFKKHENEAFVHDSKTRVEVMLESKNFKRGFPAKRLEEYREQLVYPDNDRLCEEAVWIPQNCLLTEKKDMDDIANAILKVYENRAALA